MQAHTFCSFCGMRFPEDAGRPRCCPACGNTTYRNPLPVAVALVPVEGARKKTGRKPSAVRGAA